MIISGINKRDSLKILSNNLDIKDLEIINLSTKDDWSLIAKAKNLENLKIKDSYIDYKKFYNAICSLKKLNKLTYNNYCYFNKNKKDKFLKNLNLPSLKVFRLEFPDPEELDFEINTYFQKSYKNKYNSITELKDSYKIFNNLEKIEFINYETYQKRIIECEQAKDIKKMKSEVYWNMDLKTLSNFKSLKEIKIDEGKSSDIASLGLFNLPQKQLFNINFKINGIKLTEFSKIVNDNQVITISEKKNSDGEKIKLNKINYDLFNKLKNIFQNRLTKEIFEDDLYIKKYGWKEPWRIKKNQSTKLFNENIKQLIFKDTWKFLSNYTYSENAKRKKIDLFINLLENLKNLQSVIFDISNIIYDELEQDHIIILNQFIYDLTKTFPNLKIFIKLDCINDILNSTQHPFRLYILYILNFLKKFNFFKDNLKFLDIENKKLLDFYEKNILNDVNEIIVVDDIFYNSSRKFKKIDLIFSSEAGSLIKHFQDLNINYFEDPKKKYLFENVYNEILRIIDFEDENFKKNENKLILLVKKNELEVLKDKQIEKFFLYLGNNFHSLTHQVDSDKKYKVQKIQELNEKNSKKLYQAIEAAADDFINSGQLQVNENTKKEFIQPLNNINYINNLEHLGIKKNQLNNLTHCWFEGVNPWLGKYVVLKDLNQLLPTTNLQYLRLSDCIAFNDFELPQIENLKFLRLDFHVNHHRKMIDPDHNNKLKKFSNLPSLENLELRGLYNNFSNEISKSAGFNKFGNNRWANIQVDFKDIHQLIKLKKIYISKIKGSNLQTISALSNVEKLTIDKVYNITKEMNPDEKKDIEHGTSDKDLKFLNNSKSLKELTINIGDIACKDDMWGEFLSSYYKGSGDFINYINHNITELNLNINLDINNQLCIQDFINNICNRFLKLEKLELSFGFAVNDKSFNWDITEFNKKIQLQIIDFKKFSKLKNLKTLKFWSYGSFMKYKTINFHELINLKKIQKLSWHYESIDFNEFRKTRKIFKEENYADPSYYEYDFDYYAEEDENYKKNWTRFDWIDTNFWEDDFNSLENEFIEREKEENKKRFKKSKEIIKKKKRN